MTRAHLSRRRLVALAAAAPFAPAAGQQLVVPGKKPMIVHNEFPEDLESLPEYLDTWITPVDSFFVRQHLPRPKIDIRSWRLSVGGRVGNRLSLSLGDLKAFPQVTVPATLECAGNGRSHFRPRMPGLQWNKGAIGNAEWRGPRVRDILAKAGALPSAAFADFDGADVGVAKTPDFIRSIPMRKCLHEATILALEMNGAPLPDIHGFPARLIVPGWDGASWVKWVSRIDATEQMHGGFYMNPAYRYPRNPGPPGQPVKPEDLDVLEGMAVKSFFARPASGSRHKLGAITLSGAAWAGENRIVRVDVSSDGGATWRPASLSRQDYRFAWRTWQFEWKPARPGYYTLCCRALDSAGRTQPLEAAWNPSGYLYNAVERVGVTVEG